MPDSNCKFGLTWIPRVGYLRLVRSRCNLLSCGFSLRTLNCFVASFSILIAVCSPVVAQSRNNPAPSVLAANPAAGVELDQGADAYRHARYDEAIVHFQKAVDLEPSLFVAKLYLAVALSQTVVPGATSPENLRTAQRAIDNFQQVLKGRPHDADTMKMIAAVEFSVGMLDDSKAWQKKVLVENPRDPEAAYTIGVIDWTQAHQNVLTTLAPFGLKDDGMGNASAPPKAMKAIMAQNSALIAEALKYLDEAVDNRPNYSDAMAYLNLVYRRKADVDWDNEAARNEDVANAEMWFRRSMEARKANEEKKGAGSDSEPH